MDDKRSNARLPPDVLVEVFTYCLPEEPSFRSSDAPMLLTHVCRAWRDVARGYGPLWSRIHVVTGWSKRKGPVELVKLWFSCSGKALIDIRMFPGNSMWYEETVRRFECMVEVLSLHRDRIRILDGAFPARLMAKVGISHMLNATSISYDCYDYSSNSVPTLDIGPQRNALKQLTIRGCRFDLDSLMAQTQLKEFVFDQCESLDESTALQLLKSLPALEVFVSPLTTDLTPSSSNDRILLPNLKELFLLGDTSEHDGSCVTLLDRICTPTLVELEVHADQDLSDDHNLDTVRRFLLASQAPIQVLILNDFGFSVPPPMIADFLALCEAVRCLELPGYGAFKDVFLRAMTSEGTDGDGRSQLLPNLESISFTLRDFLSDDFSRPNLVQFLESRAISAPPGISTLKNVTIACSPMNFEELRILSEACGIKNLTLREYYL